MATFETQYKNYLNENPTSTLTFDEWMEQVLSPTISDNFQIGPDEDMSDWDVTLTDGLDEYITDLDKVLLMVYMLGFNDELDGKPLIDIPTILKAYNLGKQDAINCDGSINMDYQTAEEIINKINKKDCQ